MSKGVGGEGCKLTSADNIKQFVLAGNAYFTLKNTKRGTHMTFHVNNPIEGKPGLYFVAVLVGNDNTKDYAYLGNLHDDRYTQGLVFTRGAKSKVEEKAASMMTARLLFNEWINRAAFPPALEVWHCNQCGRCGRLLTTPESCERGIGPECYKKM